MARKVPPFTKKLSKAAKACPGCFLCLGRRTDMFTARRLPAASSRIATRLRVT
jgi:hypothetical protein